MRSEMLCSNKFFQVLANANGQIFLATNNPHRNTNKQCFVHEYICGENIFFNAFATTKAVLLFRLVVIKLMFDSVQNKTCEYFINKRMLAMGLKCFGRIFLGNILNKAQVVLVQAQVVLAQVVSAFLRRFST